MRGVMLPVMRGLHSLARTLLASLILWSLAAPATAEVTGDYFPLATGSSWTVRKNGTGSFIRSVTGPVVFNGNAAVGISFSEDGEVDYYSNDAFGIRLHGGFIPSTENPCNFVSAATLTYLTPGVFANASMNVGETVTSSGPMSIVYASCTTVPLTYNSQSTLVGFELVSTPLEIGRAHV